MLQLYAVQSIRGNKMRPGLIPYTITVYGVIAGREYIITKSTCTKWAYIWANTLAGEFGNADMTIVTGYRMPTIYENVLIDFEEGEKADNALSVLGNFEIQTVALPYSPNESTGRVDAFSFASNTFQFISQIATNLGNGYYYNTGLNADSSTDVVSPLVLTEPQLILNYKGLDTAILKQFGVEHLKTYLINQTEQPPSGPNVAIEFRMPKHARFNNGYY